MNITLRYAISEYTKWVSAVWGAMARGLSIAPDGWVMLEDLNNEFKRWIGKELLDMHFMEFNATIKELSR